MAKVVPIAPASPKPSVKSVRQIFYRISRLDQYAYQGYKLTVFDDGSEHEEPVFKPDLFEIVTHKIATEIKASANKTYTAQKNAKT